MKCCLVQYLKGVRAYQRRIKELQGAVRILRTAYYQTLDEGARDRAAMKAAMAELRKEIAAARKRIAELEARDAEERGATRTAELTEPWERSGT